MLFVRIVRITTLGCRPNLRERIIISAIVNELYSYSYSKGFPGFGLKYTQDLSLFLGLSVHEFRVYCDKSLLRRLMFINADYSKEKKLKKQNIKNIENKIIEKAIER